MSKPKIIDMNTIEGSRRVQATFGDYNIKVQILHFLPRLILPFELLL